MANIDVTQVLNVVATSLAAYSKELFPNVIGNNSVLNYFDKKGKLGEYAGLVNTKKSGSIRYRKGGSAVINRLSLVENPTIGFRGYRDLVPTDDKDVLRIARFDWKFLLGNVKLWQAEIDFNSDSEWRLGDYIDSLKTNAYETARNAVSAGIWNTTSPMGMVGIPALISDNGSSVNSVLGNIGGIDSTATDNANWANRTLTIPNTVSGQTILQAIRRLKLMCTIGGKRPDLVLCNPTIYAAIQDYATTLQRFVEVPDQDLGTEVLRIEGMTFLPEENCPAGRVYLINTALMSFDVLGSSDSVIKISAPEKVPGQPQFLCPVSGTMTMTLFNRKAHGVLVISPT